MRPKSTLIFLVLLGLILPTTVTLPSPTSQWKGNIENKKSVIPSNNPDKPALGQITLTLKEDLIKNGYLYYTDSSNDEEEITVKRCKITNWDILKPSISK